MQITYCIYASRLLNLAAIFSLDFESQYKDESDVVDGVVGCGGMADGGYI